MGSTEPATFYDEHPFDWVTPGVSRQIRTVVSRPLIDFINELPSDSQVFDIGCGAGRVIDFVAGRGISCIGLDRSRVSVGIAVQRCGAKGVVGDNLHLPFADGAADFVISDGVIHHTEDPSAAFAENCRILKPGGRMYLAVYKASGRYPLLYRYPGRLIRLGLRFSWARPLVVAFAQVPYFLFHFLRSRGERTWGGASNLFYDYFVTPCVSFIPRDIIEGWCAKQEAQVLRYDENFGANVHSFLLQKKPAHTPKAQCERFNRGLGAVVPVTSQSEE